MGKPMSDTTKEKIRDALKKYWEWRRSNSLRSKGLYIPGYYRDDLKI